MNRRRYAPPPAMLEPYAPHAYVAEPAAACARFARHVDTCDDCARHPMWDRPGGHYGPPPCEKGRRLLAAWDRTLVRSLDASLGGQPAPVEVAP